MPSIIDTVEFWQDRTAFLACCRPKIGGELLPFHSMLTYPSYGFARVALGGMNMLGSFGLGLRRRAMFAERVGSGDD